MKRSADLCSAMRTVVFWTGTVLGLCAMALACGTEVEPSSARSTNPASESVVVQMCRTSPYAALEWTSEGGESQRVVSGDENVDVPGVEITVDRSSGNTLGSTTVTLRDASSNRTVQASFEVSFEQMANRHPVPLELRGTENEAWRRMVENAVFDEICTEPDPSLDRLMSMGEPLQWRSGEPSMPSNYAILVEGEVTGEPVWIEYLGVNHRRLTTDAIGDRFEVVARKDELELLRSGHGAVVVDKQRGSYTWVYVFPGGKKLRFPSVSGGAFDEDSVIVDLEAPEIGEGDKRVRIDLQSGAVGEAAGSR